MSEKFWQKCINFWPTCPFCKYTWKTEELDIDKGLYIRLFLSKKFLLGPVVYFYVVNKFKLPNLFYIN